MLILPSRPGDGAEIRRVGSLTMSQLIGGSGTLVQRSLAHGAEKRATFLLAIQREGETTLHQGGLHACLGPGDLALYSNQRDHELSSHGAYRQTLLKFPAEMMRALSPDIDGLGLARLEGSAPAARLLVSMADAMRHIPFEQVGARASAHAANAMAQLLACALITITPAAARPASLTLFHIARIKQHIVTNLHNSELSVASVSTALKISPAHIHRMFSGEPHSFSEWLWHQRLLVSQAALINPAQASDTVSQIAYSSGFNNLSHFSRAFRNKFGQSPSACRAQTAR